MSKSPVLKWSILLSVSLIVAGAIAFFFAPEKMAKMVPYAPQLATGNLTIKVTDMDGNYIPATKIEYGSNKSYKEIFSDKNGEHKANIDRSTGRVRITIKAPGYVTAYGTWGRDSYPLDQLKDKIEVKLEKGSNIGGKLVDLENNPIVGAKVSVHYEGEKKPNEPFYQLNYRAVVQSNNKGEWLLKEAPKELKVLRLSIEHPAFLAKKRSISVAEKDFESFENLTDVRKMEPGIVVTGTVRGPDGEPVEGAYVTPGRSPWEGRRRRAIIRKTDKSGKFSFKGCEPGSSYLTVLAKGLAPKVKKVKFVKGMNPVSFRLAEGKTIKIQALDKNKKPIANANINLNQYKGIQSLSQLFNHVMTNKTDNKGMFIWKGAPTEPVSLYVYKEGFNSSYKNSITPKDEPYEFTLRPPLKVKATVVDAETGSPIQNFKYLYGIKWNGNSRVSWQNHRNGSGKNGDFNMTINDGSDNRSFAVKVTADGYFPTESPTFKGEDGDQTLTLKMKKGTGPKGIIQNSAGKPVVNAYVGVFTAEQRLSLYNGKLNTRNAADKKKTDKDGKFTLAPVTAEYGIVAVDDSGVAILTQEEFETINVITLKPWASIHGVAKIGKNLAQEKRISLYNYQTYVHGKPRLDVRNTAETDDKGFYEMEKVVPGQITVSLQKKIESGRHTQYLQVSNENSEIQPGGKLEINLGGKGKPVIGKVIFPKGLKAKLYMEYRSYSIQEMTKPVLSKPTSSNPLTNAINSLFGGTKKSTATSQKVIQVRPRNYQFNLNEDNTFRIEDVIPGNYRINFHFMYRQGLEGIQQYSQAGGINKEFTIGEIPNGLTDEPFDLGDLKLLTPEEQKKQREKKMQERMEKQRAALKKRQEEMKAKLKAKKETPEKTKKESQKEEPKKEAKEKKTEKEKSTESKKPESVKEAPETKSVESKTQVEETKSKEPVVKK